ncbi:MAG: hypothetical protein HC945_01265 [Nitrosarchaeum sp.]|nr:hypothetical protein [Nitrosarchaeum sp.]
MSLDSTTLWHQTLGKVLLVENLVPGDRWRKVLLEGDASGLDIVSVRADVDVPQRLVEMALEARTSLVLWEDDVARRYERITGQDALEQVRRRDAHLYLMGFGRYPLPTTREERYDIYVFAESPRAFAGRVQDAILGYAKLLEKMRRLAQWQKP